jgi:hypothetical protein
VAGRGVIYPPPTGARRDAALYAAAAIETPDIDPPHELTRSDTHPELFVGLKNPIQGWVRNRRPNLTLVESVVSNMRRGQTGLAQRLGKKELSLKF